MKNKMKKNLLTQLSLVVFAGTAVVPVVLYSSSCKLLENYEIAILNDVGAFHHRKKKEIQFCIVKRQESLIWCSLVNKGR